MANDKVPPMRLVEALKYLGWTDEGLRLLMNASPEFHQELQQRLIGSESESIWHTIPAVVVYRRLVNELHKNGCQHVGDVMLFTKDEWLKKPGIKYTLLNQLEYSLDRVGLELSTDNDESMRSRVARIYGSIRGAPVSVLVAIPKLSIYRMRAVRLNYVTFARFINSLDVATVGEVADMTRIDLILRGNSNAMDTIQPIAQLKEVLQTLGLDIHEESNPRAT